MDFGGLGADAAPGETCGRGRPRSQAVRAFGAAGYFGGGGGGGGKGLAG